MWNWADDYGRGTLNLKELEGFIFPNDDIKELSVGTSENFRRVVKEVVDTFGIIIYEVHGRTYYAIPTWADHQRTERKAKSKYPAPEDGENVSDQWSDGSSYTFLRTASEVPTQGGGSSRKPEHRNRGTGEQGNSARSARGARKAPAKRLPEDWAPTDAHRKKAAELGVDLELEADRFRLHAEANDRRAVRWDAAFSMWLSKATPPLPGMGARGNANDRRVQDTAALLNRAPWEGATLTTDDWRAERERTAHGHPNHPTLDTQGALEA